MFGSALSFTNPAILTAFVLLPVIWWLLRLMPPRPQLQAFPPTRLLAELAKKEDTPHTSPWWLTALRLLLAAFTIFALAGPFWQPNPATLASTTPLVLVIDNGWSTATDWLKRREAAQAILAEATRSQKPVALVMTTDPENQEIRLGEPQAALDQLRAQTAMPYAEERGVSATRLANAKKNLGTVDVIWLASPLKTKDDNTFAQALTALGDTTIRYEPQATLAITSAQNSAATLDVTIKRLSAFSAPLVLRAFDKDGLSLADKAIAFEDDALETSVEIELPIELRNDIIRLSLIDENQNAIESAGAVHLLDDRSRRRSVGLLSGVAIDQAQQPLLSPLYYIRRALEPFADLRDPATANLAEAVPTLLQSGVSMIIMADIGTLPDKESEQLHQFIEKGGTVVRFAGPRLAASKDELTPVRLRAGERNLGGSLTWEEPQKLARFAESGPFAGMNLPDDIEIRRQVLAEPDFDLLQKTWAELADGTPLVTAQKIDNGWLILFHVTADATWSNLPISGAFVDMLVKLVAFSAVPASALPAQPGNEVQVFPPFQTLYADGRLGPPLPNAEPINLATLSQITASRTTPPGLYGKSESLIAHNLMRHNTPFEALAPTDLLPDTPIAPLSAAGATDLRPMAFTGALLLLLVDALVVAAMAGLFSRNVIRRLRPIARLLALLAPLAIMLIGHGSLDHAKAQTANAEPSPPYEATLTTRLAYVITGDSETDAMSEAGLIGLSAYLRQRTALEPGAPVGLDIARDEMSFYAFLYWPVTAKAMVPDAATMARVDAFMKQGGTVLFDTRDQIDASLNPVTPANLKLRQIVASLDVPPLEAVPANHVLTRSFYLLQDFPGRWDGSPLWVEATENSEKTTEESRSTADGVSSIMITANDFAGAWAVDANERPLLPTVPNDPNQRIYAFRTGVNIVMYTLTGNYKADQVHIPALLERLGQ